MKFERLRLIAARARAGITQEQLARDVQCSTGTISKLEQRGGNPSAALLARIERRLGVEPGELMSGAKARGRR